MGEIFKMFRCEGKMAFAGRGRGAAKPVSAGKHRKSNSPANSFVFAGQTVAEMPGGWVWPATFSFEMHKRG